MTFVSAIATMYQSMLIKYRTGQEGLVAHVAFERSLLRVLLPDVIRQIRLYRETLIAVITNVRFYAHVESPVSPHVAGLSVTFSTDVANVRSQSVVPSLVSVQRVCGGQ